jgi:hypothetical protein
MISNVAEGSLYMRGRRRGRFKALQHFSQPKNVNAFLRGLCRNQKKGKIWM